MQSYLQLDFSNKTKGHFDIITSQIITTVRLKATDSILAGIQSYATYSECAAIMP